MISPRKLLAILLAGSALIVKQPDGAILTTISQSLRTDSARVDLISSSPLPRAAEGNARTFRSLFVIRMAIDADTHRGGGKRQ